MSRRNRPLEDIWRDEDEGEDEEEEEKEVSVHSIRAKTSI